VTLMAGGKKVLVTIVLYFILILFTACTVQQTCVVLVVAYISYPGYASAPNVLLPIVLTSARSVGTVN
jgi:hypothetical protein